MDRRGLDGGRERGQLSSRQRVPGQGRHPARFYIPFRNQTGAIGLVRGVRQIDTDRTSTITAPLSRSPASHGRLSELEHRGEAFAHIGPNWFAAVMGTGILATAAMLLPVHVAGQTEFAVGAWALAAALLMVITAATIAHWVRYPSIARSHHRNP